MKKNIVAMSLVSFFVLIFTISIYKQPNENAIPAITSMILMLGAFASICFSLSGMNKIPLAENILQIDTDYEILGVYPEEEEYILVVAEVVNVDIDSEERKHISVRINRDNHRPEIGKVFYVDNKYHLIIDGARTEIKSAKEMLSDDLGTS